MQPSQPAITVANLLKHAHFTFYFKAVETESTLGVHSKRLLHGVGIGSDVSHGWITYSSTL